VGAGKREAPDAVEQELPRENAVGIPEQDRQQVELARRQRHLVACDRDLPRVAPQHNVARRELGLVEPRLRAPEHRPDARDQLARREGFREVVVGAELEPAHPVRLLVARREHEDRHARVRANPPADLEAVHVR